MSSVAFICRIEKENSINLPSEIIEKAFVAWMNSTLSLIYLKPLTSSVAGNFGHVRGWHLRRLLVPRLDDKRICKELSEVFEKYKEEELQSLPNQYEEVIYNHGGLRLDYDIDILRALNPNFDIEELKRHLINIYINFLEIISGA